MAMNLLFWICILLIGYAYAGYPALLSLMVAISQKPVKKKASEPKVSIVMSAFNEERWIERKLQNLVELDYPLEKLEILVGSDGAFDRTDEIVSRFPSTQVRFFRFVRNLGKPHVLSALVKEAQGEIVVFTDVRQEFDRQAIRALVANFEDPQVGCVSGELYFQAVPNGTTGSIGKGMDVYWRYEKFLRKKESELGSMLGATGAIYAIRKELFPEHLPPDVLVDDMYIPFSMIQKGYRAVFESEAHAYDRISRDGSQEFKRKVRTLAGNVQIFAFFPELFHPFKSQIAWQLFSHKLLRLLVPFFMVGLFVSNFLLIRKPFFFWFFLAQLCFYGMALLEMWYVSFKKAKRGIGYIPYTFCLLNYSALVGVLRFFKGRQKVNWEKAYV